MRHPQAAARRFYESGEFAISAFHPLTALQFDIAVKDGRLSCVVPEIESRKVFHLCFLFEFLALGNHSRLLKTDSQNLANHQEKKFSLTSI